MVKLYRTNEEIRDDYFDKYEKRNCDFRMPVFDEAGLRSVCATLKGLNTESPLNIQNVFLKAHLEFNVWNSHQ